MRSTKTLATLAFLILALLARAAQAEPITLKAAFFSSDRSILYRATMKPLIDQVNVRGKNGIEIVLYSGGVLGREIAQQPKVVRDGIADIGWIVPGYTPELFPDNAVIEIPGLFRDLREATLVNTRLTAKDMLRGYEDFVVLGAYATQPETIHSRVPIRSIDDLKGKRIRVNNAMEAAAFELLGASPVMLEVHQIATALTSGVIDAASIPLTPLFDYGIKRIATYHFLLSTSSAPLVVLMNRRKFESLPQLEQALLRKYSGEWAAEQFIEVYDDSNLLKELRSEAGRTVTEPSASDLARARAVFDQVTKKWLGTDERRAALLKAAQAELAKLRAH